MPRIVFYTNGHDKRDVKQRSVLSDLFLVIDRENIRSPDLLFEHNVPDVVVLEIGEGRPLHDLHQPIDADRLFLFDMRAHNIDLAIVPAGNGEIEAVLASRGNLVPDVCRGVQNILVHGDITHGLTPLLAPPV